MLYPEAAGKPTNTVLLVPVQTQNISSPLDTVIDEDSWKRLELN